MSSQKNLTLNFLTQNYPSAQKLYNNFNLALLSRFSHIYPDYNFIPMHSSRPRKINQQEKIDQQYLSKVYEQISSKMQILDKLNKEYHNRQQQHFLKTFMSVLQKMGKDLQAAQQAYRNIDFQIKKDQHSIILAGEVNYFKFQSYHLNDQLIAKEKENTQLKLLKDVLQTQMQSLRRAFDVKVRETLRLKSQIRVLKNQLRIMHLDQNSNPRMPSQDNKLELKVIRKSSLSSYLLQGNPETPRTISKDLLQTKNRSKFLSRGKETAVTPTISKHTIDSQTSRKKQFRSARNFYHKKLTLDQNRMDMDYSINTQLKMY